MRKFLSLVVAVLLLGGIVGCSQVREDENGIIYNEKFDEEKMKNVKGNDVKIKDNDDVISCKTSGFAFTKPKSWETVKNQNGIIKQSLDPEAFYGIYMPKEQADKYKSINKDTMSEDDIKVIKKEANDSELAVFAIYRVNEEEEETVKDAEEYKKDFTQNEEVGRIRKNIFYLAYNKEISKDGLSDEDKEDIKKLIDSVKDIKENIILFTPTDPMDDFKASMVSFKTTDIYGKEVNESIFKDYDVTMVNVWATWCKYCVSEMPEIQKMYENLPKNANIITICIDGSSKSEDAKRILNQTGAKFVTLNSNDELQGKVIDYVKGYPTTFFVDKNGKVVGKLQIGTPTSDEEKIADAYTNLLNDALKSVGK